jgi:nucleotide-binding universal stress UspA family protein
MPVIGDQIGLSIDRVVLATDFSPASEGATDYAKVIAKRFSSTLTVANVVDLSVATRSEKAVVGLPIDDLHRTSGENLERLLNELTVEGVRVVAQSLEAHNPAAAIVGLSEQVHADLIVTGTHSRHGLSKAILGSCSEGIIRHANRPVMTVGPKCKPVPKDRLLFSTILFATDFHSDTREKAAVALAFARDSIAKIYLCHVLNRPGEDISETLGLQLKFESELQKLVPQSVYDCCSPESVVEIGEAAPRLLELAKKVGADLIVLGAKRKSSWFADLNEGVVGQVLRQAECPVMTIT